MSLPMPPARPRFHTKPLVGFVGMAPARPGPAPASRAIPRPPVPTVSIPPLPLKREVRPRRAR